MIGSDQAKVRGRYVEIAPVRKERFASAQNEGVAHRGVPNRKSSGFFSQAILDERMQQRGGWPFQSSWKSEDVLEELFQLSSRSLITPHQTKVLRSFASPPSQWDMFYCALHRFVLVERATALRPLLQKAKKHFFGQKMSGGSKKRTTRARKTRPQARKSSRRKTSKLRSVNGH